MAGKKEPRGKGTKIFSEADAALWDAAMRDVKPLPGEKRRARKTKTAGQKASGINIRETRGVAKTDSPKGKTSRGIDARTDEKLRRGKFEIEARIDLHGFRQKEARTELVKALTRCRAAGKRCVLVITGKGKTKSENSDWWDGKPGVLRDMVPVWLKEKPLSGVILQVHPAQPKDGGAGALYVLLRRARV